jgi:hypothetical protein
VAVHLGGPGADLEAEGDGHRLLAVGPADHRRGAVGPGQVTEQFFQPFEVPADNTEGFLLFQDPGRIEDILGRDAEMDIAAVLRAAHLLQPLQERDKGVAAAAVRGGDKCQVDFFQAGVGRNGSGRRSRDKAQLSLGFGQGRLDLQPAAKSRLLVKDGGQFRSGV